MSNMKKVFHFLQWKLSISGNSFTESDRTIIEGRHYPNYKDLSLQVCFYTKTLMNSYLESIWQCSLENKLHAIGETRVPKVSTNPIPMPLGTPRKIEVIVLSFLYKQNLLNTFLYLAQSKKCASPICECGTDEQTAHHILTSCQLVDDRPRMEILRVVGLCNEESDPPSDYITLLNCSRDHEFINSCIDIVNENKPRFRTKYSVIRNY